MDASVDGFHLSADPAGSALPEGSDDLSLVIREVGEVPLQILRRWPGRLSGRFVLSEAQRDALIRKLFSGNYSNHVSRVQSWRKLLQRMWRKAMH